MGDTALITGSTSGIGKAFADKMAKEGYHLVLVSRNADKLHTQSEYLQRNYNIEIYTIACDLADSDSAEMIFKKLQYLDIDIQVLINNAGFNEFGSFLKTNSENELNMMKLHMFFATKMMKLFLPSMVKNGYGRVLNVGSIGSYIPCPYNAVYSATKSYILSVSESISAELKNTGVTITTLCPGSTRTEFASKANMEETLLFKIFVMSPEKVADIGYRAMIKGKVSVIAGTYNKLLVFSSYILPRHFVNYLSKKMLMKSR